MNLKESQFSTADTARESGEFRLSKATPEVAIDGQTASESVSKADRPKRARSTTVPKFRPTTCNDFSRNQTAEFGAKAGGWQGKTGVIKQYRPSMPKVGSVLGRCCLLHKLSDNDGSIVFKAHHKTLDVDIAVKVFAPDEIDEGAAFRKLFSQEAKILARVSSPNIVRVLDYEEGYYPYMIMEYVDGASMLQRLKRSGTLGLQATARTILGAAYGLRDAHQAGIIHRDVKPANILAGNRGEVKIADLGMALFDEKLSRFHEDHIMAYCGSAEYMAPEQALNPDEISEAADVYGLGASLFHGLTGRVPFDSHSKEGLIDAHANEALPRPGKFRNGIPDRLECLVMEMMEKEPTRRPAMTAVIRALESLTPGLK